MFFVRTSALGLLLIALSAAAAPPISAETVRPTVWQVPTGESFEGRLSEVLGSVVVVTGKNRNALLLLKGLSDAETEQVADFLQVKAAGPAVWQDSNAKVSKALRGKLQQLQEGRLVDVDLKSRPEPEVYLIYFSAGGCPPCHRFMPFLVKAYERYQKAVPGKVEVIFVSSDEGASQQVAYVKKSAMPWPVLRFSALRSVREIERWAGSGIPCLVAITRSGDVLFHSYKGDEYLGPDHVLAACDQLIETMTANAPSARRDRHRLAVIEHLRTTTARETEPKPYLLYMDGKKYGEMQAGPFPLDLNIDERGRVVTTRFGDDVPAALRDMLTADVSQWLFLPAVKAGQPHACTVRVPVKIGGASAVASGK